MNNEEFPLSPTHMRATHYNMKHPKRGMALIFNHELFKDDYAKLRTGTNVDCQQLISCFGELGFEVKDYQDLNFKDIKDQLQADIMRIKTVAEIDHTNNDCLVIAILTHGEAGTLFAHDMKYDERIVWTNFTSDKCKTLAGKPKMFFIQACRGEEYDHGSTMVERTETDGSQVFRLPSHADFLFAYATVPGKSTEGHYSWRINTKGTWFIQALCSELRDNGRKFDLLTLLTFVCQRVAIDFESYDPDYDDISGKKQIPCIESRLTRLVQF